MLAMVKNERAILSRLDHPNIIKLVECFQTGDELFYVLEKGGSELLEFIKMCHHLHLSQLRTITAELVLGLEYLKQSGVIHRDLKPENVLLNDKNHVKIIDFGTAFIDGGPAEEAKKEKSGGRLPRGKTFCGSTHYLSPEVIDGLAATNASDLWALGCILYHMACGRRPFEGSMVDIFEKLRNPEGHVRFPGDCPPHVRDLCCKLLRKVPEQRLGATEAGYEALRKHPLFQGIDFAALPTAELEYQWHPVAAAWVRDCDSANCRKCQAEFSVTRRKHHCRRCGQIFCAKCSANRLVIPGLFRDERVRLCDACCRVVQGQPSSPISTIKGDVGSRSFRDPVQAGPTDIYYLSVAIIAGHGQWDSSKAFCEIKLKRVVDGVVLEGLHPQAQKVTTKTVSCPEPKWGERFNFRVPAGDAIRVSAFSALTFKKQKIGQVDLRLAEVAPLLSVGGDDLVDRYPVTLSKEQDGGRMRETGSGEVQGTFVEIALRLDSRSTLVPIPTDVDVDFVEFQPVRDPPVVLRFTADPADPGALRYTTDGEAKRPPFRKMFLVDRTLRVRFPDISTACVLPQDRAVEILAGLKCLARKAGCECNFPDTVNPAEAAARTNVTARRATVQQAEAGGLKRGESLAEGEAADEVAASGGAEAGGDAAYDILGQTATSVDDTADRAVGALRAALYSDPTSAVLPGELTAGWAPDDSDEEGEMGKTQGLGADGEDDAPAAEAAQAPVIQRPPVSPSRRLRPAKKVTVEEASEDGSTEQCHSGLGSP
eukprot:TRINITY_DN475_c5_g1_i1.p1 TRINITY_DN475_c5_g1~~TRINITY_DN475_c5_g1_i1.p1  ORF type:complete len:857 (+),score=295.27 TRINITY_DN475_c5_g1_i1:271-2571(+)